MKLKSKFFKIDEIPDSNSQNVSITTNICDLIYILQKIPDNIYYEIDIPNNGEYILPNWYQNCTVADKVDFTNWLRDSQKYPTQSQPLDKTCNINICGEHDNLIKFCDELLKMRSDLDILVQQLKQILENNEKSSN